MRHLVGRIADQNVDAAEFAGRAGDYCTTVIRVRQITGHQHASAPGFLDESRDLFSVVVFVEVGDQHVSSLSREGDRPGAPDAPVTPSNRRLLTGQST